MPAQLIDIGVNLTHRRFDKDRPEVIAAALEAGVDTLLLTGVHLAGAAAACELAQANARRHPQALYFTAGVHPHYASDWQSDTGAQLQALWADPLCVAVGECGLDFNRNLSSPAQQETAFQAQLELGQESGKAFFFHEREAHARFMALVTPFAPELRGVVHCFTGQWAEVEAYLKLGLFIGFTGAICDERLPQLPEVVRRTPLERLLLETDAPFQSPRTIRPRLKRNTPAILPHIAQAVAQYKGISVAEVAQATTANAHRLFGLPPRSE